MGLKASASRESFATVELKGMFQVRRIQQFSVVSAGAFGSLSFFY